MHPHPQEAESTGPLCVDGFQVQRANKPSSAITSHLAKDGTPSSITIRCEIRSLTVRAGPQAARPFLTTTSSKVLLEPSGLGVGNAVPPWLRVPRSQRPYDALK